jgi:ubiquinone/menaquinone biosynthesis C-methylase UbiE
MKNYPTSTLANYSSSFASNIEVQFQQTKGYVDSGYLQTTSDLLQPFKQRSYEMMQIQPYHRLLDVGCGPGSDTITLARFVPLGGRVVGVDHDPEMVAEADRRAIEAGVSRWVSHKHASVDTLPFESDFFDACRSERVFQHLNDPQPALAEMVRVTKPGGRVVVWDADWGTLSIDTNEVSTERTLARIVAEKNVNNGFSGRQLYRLFMQQGLEVVNLEANTLFFTNYPLMRQVVGIDEVETEASTSGLLSQSELSHWHIAMEEAQAKGWFFASVTGILITGKKSLT